MKKHLLISAYGCEPNRGSESGVGWNWVLQLAKDNYLHVITRTNNKELIESNLPEEYKEKIIFHYYDPPALIRKIKNKDRGLYFFYFLWQIGIIPLVSRLMRQYEFDYTIHLTFGSLWMPTFLPLFRVPFIWGPVGGGDCEPRSFWKSFPFKNRVFMLARYFLKKTSLFNPFVLLPSWRAVAILVRTDDSAMAIPSFFRNKVKVVLETGMDGDVLLGGNNDTILRDSQDIGLVFTGRLESNKNIDMLLYALSYIPNDYKFHLNILGEGSQKNKLIALAETLEIKSKVSFFGNVPRSQIFRYLKEADIFLFPSLREGGSWALMEAMSVGLPVICCYLAGMRTITDDQSAIRLNVHDPEQLRKEFTDAIIRLMDDEELRVRIGENARKRIKECFSWESKRDFMERIFSELQLNNRINS